MDTPCPALGARCLANHGVRLDIRKNYFENEKKRLEKVKKRLENEKKCLDNDAVVGRIDARSFTICRFSLPKQPFLISR